MPRMSPWTIYTKQLLEVADLSQTRFAEILSRSMKRPLTQGYVSGRLMCETTVPPDVEELEHWAESMGLRGEMRKKFFRLAQFERIPSRYRREYTEVFDLYEKTKKKLDDTVKQNAELKALLDTMQAKLVDLTAKTAKRITEDESSGHQVI